MVQKVTEDEFRLIKSKLRYSNPVRVATQVGRHLAIVVKVDSSKNYQQYRAIVKAEHPPVKNSIANRVSELEQNQQQLTMRVDALEQNRERDRSQLALDLNEDGIHGKPNVK